MKRVLGQWNHTVVLTYIGVILSIVGMYFAIHYEFRIAILCMIWAGVADLLDGPVARKANRSLQEKSFGSAIDAVADVINFLAFPMILGISLSTIDAIPGHWGLIVYSFYGIMGIARLADFQSEQVAVTRHETGDAPDEPVAYYLGVPVTYASLVFPLVMIVQRFLRPQSFYVYYLIAMVILGILFILPIKITKPRKVGIILFGIIAIVASVYFLFFARV